MTPDDKALTEAEAILHELETRYWPKSYDAYRKALKERLAKLVWMLRIAILPYPEGHLMNLTVDQFINGLERTARELPTLLSEWDTIGEDLAMEYSEQLQWLLRMQPEIRIRAEKEGASDQFDRMDKALLLIHAEKKRIQELIGIEV